MGNINIKRAIFLLVYVSPHERVCLSSFGHGEAFSNTSEINAHIIQFGLLQLLFISKIKLTFKGLEEEQTLQK